VGSVALVKMSLYGLSCSLKRDSKASFGAKQQNSIEVFVLVFVLVITLANP